MNRLGQSVQVTLPGPTPAPLPGVINESIDVYAGPPDTTTYTIWAVAAVVFLLILKRR